jgi:hypothetical protein
VERQPVVYIDRYYNDPIEGEQRWPRRRQWLNPGVTWEAGCEHGDRYEEGGRFETVEDAIAWGRARSEVVLVRLGSVIDAMYSAGTKHAAERVDGTGWKFPPWPPATWPEYDGPPETGWPEHECNEDES